MVLIQIGVAPYATCRRSSTTSSAGGAHATAATAATAAGAGAAASAATGGGCSGQLRYSRFLHNRVGSLITVA